jgi:hypothetical protein
MVFVSISCFQIKCCYRIEVFTVIDDVRCYIKCILFCESIKFSLLLFIDASKLKLPLNFLSFLHDELQHLLLYFNHILTFLHPIVKTKIKVLCFSVKQFSCFVKSLSDLFYCCLYKYVHIKFLTFSDDFSSNQRVNK